MIDSVHSMESQQQRCRMKTMNAMIFWMISVDKVAHLGSAYSNSCSMKNHDNLPLHFSNGSSINALHTWLMSKMKPSFIKTGGSEPYN